MTDKILFNWGFWNFVSLWSNSHIYILVREKEKTGVSEFKFSKILSNILSKTVYRNLIFHYKISYIFPNIWFPFIQSWFFSKKNLHSSIKIYGQNYIWNQIFLYWYKNNYISVFSKLHLRCHFIMPPKYT